MPSVSLKPAAFSEFHVRFETPDHCTPVGYAWLMANFDVRGPRPFQLSYVRASGVPFESREGEYVQALEEAVGGAWQGAPGSSAEDGEGPQRPGA